MKQYQHVCWARHIFLNSNRCIFKCKSFEIKCLTWADLSKEAVEVAVSTFLKALQEV